MANICPNFQPAVWAVGPPVAAAAAAVKSQSIPRMTRIRRLRETLARTAGPPSLLVVSDSHIGTTLAATLAADADIHLVTDREAVAGAAPDDVCVTVGDVTTLRTFGDVSDVTAAVVALGTDRQTLLLTQLLRTRSDIESLVVLLNDPTRRAAIADIASTVVCGSATLSAALQREVESILGEEQP